MAKKRPGKKLIEKNRHPSWEDVPKDVRDEVDAQIDEYLGALERELDRFFGFTQSDTKESEKAKESGSRLESGRKDRG